MSADAMRHDDRQKSPMQDESPDANLDLLGQRTMEVSGEADEDDSLQGDDALFQAAMTSYRDESMQWAERRSSTMPVPRPAPAQSWWRVPATAFAAAALAAVVGATAMQHHLHERMAEASAPFAQPSSQTLASDNQLLSSVDAALGQSTTPTEQQLGLPTPGSGPAKRAFSATLTGNVR